MVLNNSLTHYGALSVYGEDIPLAACGIVMKTNAILLAIIVGISQGVQPIIGFNFGAGKYDRVRQAYRLAIVWNFVVSAVGFCLFQFFPAPIISLFGNGEPLYFEFAILFMRTFLFMVLVNGVQLLSSNFFTAIGKALKGLLLSLTRQVFFLIPLVILLPLRFGIFGVLLAGPIADFIAFVVSVFLVSREFKTLAAQQKNCTPQER
ncbi:MATE family efflux transporter [Flavonifractor sp. HCP28S3_F3]|uniref:MATE family efflux transporter n=1 Tax=Flavonifractor sp. HCP28S3_F3 TaxID=3438939 RepID=UPI003F88889E